MKKNPMTIEELTDHLFIPADGAPTCMIQRIPTLDEELAKMARKAILTERARRNESGLPFDVGFACGLSFALGAFSGVCEEKE